MSERIEQTLIDCLDTCGHGEPFPSVLDYMRFLTHCCGWTLSDAEVVGRRALEVLTREQLS